MGTYYVDLFVNTITVTYFDSFGVEHIPKEIRKFIRNNNEYLYNAGICSNNEWILLYQSY